MQQVQQSQAIQIWEQQRNVKITCSFHSLVWKANGRKIQLVSSSEEEGKLISLTATSNFGCEKYYAFGYENKSKELRFATVIKKKSGDYKIVYLPTEDKPGKPPSIDPRTVNLNDPITNPSIFYFSTSTQQEDEVDGFVERSEEECSRVRNDLYASNSFYIIPAFNNNLRLGKEDKNSQSYVTVTCENAVAETWTYDDFSFQQ